MSEILENSICLNYDKYKSLVLEDSKQIFIKTNLETVLMPEKLLLEFINNQSYFEILESSLIERVNLNLTLTENEEILVKKVYSPISIILGLKSKEAEFTNEQLRNFKVLFNKTDFKKYLAKNATKVYKLNFDNKDVSISYADLFSIILDETEYNKFINNKGKYNGFFKEEFIYMIKKFITEKRIFISFFLDADIFNRYLFLVQTYDTDVINKYVQTKFKYLDQIDINKNFEKDILASIPEDISNLEKIVWIYLNLHKYLKFDFELDDESEKVKKHKDYTRIVDISKENNYVFSYEFSALFGKFLDNMQIKFEYNDKYIIARIGKYLVKFKAISNQFNSDNLPVTDIIKGVILQNSNLGTKEKFLKIYNKVYKKIYQEKIDLKILRMPFKSLLNLYRMSSPKISVDFSKKYDIFLRLIQNVYHSDNAIGYIYELRKTLFAASELDANISFATISEQKNNKVDPIVIVTVNDVNINLYNSNKYIYYNPPENIRILNIKELRNEFFKGNFKYIKGNNDNIIGAQKL